MEKEIIIPDASVYEQAAKWITGEQTSMDEREVKAFLDSMIRGFRRRFSEVHPTGGIPRFRPLTMPTVSLAALVGPELSKEVKELIKTEAPAVEKKEGEPVDSVTVLNAIGHIATLSGKRITSSRAQLILYCVYGSWLASHGSRIEMEHPQAWKYGPVFPRAYRHSNLGDAKACAEAYALLSEKHPELATLVSSKTLSMLFTTMTDLDTVHVRSRSCPYSSVMRENPKAWGTQIPDSLIASFFAR